MERLGDAYTGSRWEGRDPRRVAAGAVLFVVGLLAVVASVVVGTGHVDHIVGAADTVEAQGIAGIVAGLGIPALMVGIVVVLPASRRERVGVLAGTVLCVAGVGLFTHAYPTRWTGTEGSLAFPTTLTYFLGGCLAFWFVFTAIASFRVRNTPGGTIRMELTRQGETRTVQLPRDQYRQYRDAIRSDGGQTDQVIRELESRFEE